MCVCVGQTAGQQQIGLTCAAWYSGINDLESEFLKGLKTTLYAGSLVTWCNEEKPTTASRRMLMAADKFKS